MKNRTILIICWKNIKQKSKEAQIKIHHSNESMSHTTKLLQNFPQIATRLKKDETKAKRQGEDQHPYQSCSVQKTQATTDENTKSNTG